MLPYGSIFFILLSEMTYPINWRIVSKRHEQVFGNTYIYCEMKETDFFRCIAVHASESELSYVEKAVSPVRLFVAAHRGISRKLISMEEILGFPCQWTLDRLVRVYALTQMSEMEMESLWDTAEINESVALYSSLMYLKSPEKWVYRGTEAVRSNIGDVFDAIAFENLYPSKHFSEAQWNQLVLKCIFNDKGIHRILGLNERKNMLLASSISDFAHERWAAGRQVPAQVWRLVDGFEYEGKMEDLRELKKSGRVEDQIALAILENDEKYTWSDLEKE